MEENINTITKYKLIQSGDKIVLAVSGGPDSISMLHILNEIKDEYNFQIYVAHINHMIREEADEKRKEVETRLSDFETEKQMENDSLEAQLQHCTENKEAYKELAIQNAQDNASYFQ